MAIGLGLVARVWLDLAPGLGLPWLAAPLSALLLILVAVAVDWRDPAALVREEPWAAAFAVVIGLAAIRSDDPLYWTGLLLGPPLLLVAAGQAGVEAGRTWAGWVAAAAVVPVVWALVAWVAGQPAEHVVNGYPRLLGGYGSPHAHATALVAFAAIGLWWTRDPRVEVSRLAWVALGVVGALMLATWVRTALGMVAVACAVVAARNGRWRELGGATALAVVVVAVVPGLRDRFGELAAALAGRPPTGGWGAFGSFRGTIWVDAWRSFLEHGPLAVGAGLGLGAHQGLHRDLDPHSDLSSLWFQAGLLAPVTWLGMVGHAARRALRGPDRAFGEVAAALAVAMVVAAPFSNDVLPRATLTWWAFAALGSAKGRSGALAGSRTRGHTMTEDTA